MMESVDVNCVSGLFKYQNHPTLVHCLNMHHQGSLIQGGFSMAEEAIRKQMTVPNSTEVCS